jgi:predicted transposase/invertase (TIGR01784 family)
MKQLKKTTKQTKIMPHYLDPKNDLTFKCVFGNHKHLCMSLLNSLLPLNNPIVSLEYETGELVPEIKALHNSIVDVRCIDSAGRQFLVEMQMEWTENFKSRVLLNASKAYVVQLDKAKDYKLLQPVYSLNFVNDTFEKSPAMKDEYYHHYKIVNIKDTDKQIKGLEFVFIELPKFKPQNRAEKKLHELWLTFLTAINESTEIAPPELLENNDTREAMQYAEISAYTKKQLITYDRIRDGIMVEITLISAAQEEGFNKGMKKGLKKGIEKGIEKGLKQGIEKGIEKGMERVAQEAHKKGLPIEIIQAITGLSEMQIKKIVV